MLEEMARTLFNRVETHSKPLRGPTVVATLGN